MSDSTDDALGAVALGAAAVYTAPFWLPFAAVAGAGYLVYKGMEAIDKESSRQSCDEAKQSHLDLECRGKAYQNKYSRDLY